MAGTYECVNETSDSMKWNGGLDSIDLAQDRDRWRALMSAVMNLLVP